MQSFLLAAIHPIRKFWRILLTMHLSSRRTLVTPMRNHLECNPTFWLVTWIPLQHLMLSMLKNAKLIFTHSTQLKMKPIPRLLSQLHYNAESPTSPSYLVAAIDLIIYWAWCILLQLHTALCTSATHAYVLHNPTHQQVCRLLLTTRSRSYLLVAHV